MPARNMLEQLLALYTNPESQNAQRHRWTDGQQDDANSRSYCVAVPLAKNHVFLLDKSKNKYIHTHPSLNSQSTCSLWVARDRSFPWQIYQIPRLTATKFPCIPINFLRPWKLTKYAVFVVGELPQLRDTVCLPNKQAVFQLSSMFSIFLTLELEMQSRI